jgi:hypothetical protein
MTESEIDIHSGPPVLWQSPGAAQRPRFAAPHAQRSDLELSVNNGLLDVIGVPRYAQQPLLCWTGGHLMLPKEQKTQQSPAKGFSCL